MNWRVVVVVMLVLLQAAAGWLPAVASAHLPQGVPAAAGAVTAAHARHREPGCHAVADAAQAGPGAGSLGCALGCAAAAIALPPTLAGSLPAAGGHVLAEAPLAHPAGRTPAPETPPPIA